MKKKLVIFALLVIVANLFFFLYLKPRSRSAEELGGDSSLLPQKEVSLPTKEELFTISGNLIGDGNPWKLIYDDAQTGAVAATLDLIFNDQSVCDFGQGDTSCQPMFIEIGSRVLVQGNKNDDQVTVVKLTRDVSLLE